MKRVLLGIVIFMCCVGVEAKDYPTLTLIPVDEEASVTTNTFFYHNLYYDSSDNQANHLNQNVIKFDSIKNLDNKDRFVSISIGFFNDNKENIGIYNYCSNKDKDGANANLELKQNEEKATSIVIYNDYLVDKNNVNNVKYISVMSDNPNCNSGTNYDFVGKRVEYIDFIDKEAYDYGFIKYYFYVLLLIVAILVIKLFFDKTINRNNQLTNKLLGVSEKDLRSDEEIKDEYFKRREEENKKKKKVVKKKEVKDISQEKGNTDLHNMYK